MADETARKRLMFSCLVAAFIVPFSGSALNVAMPDIARDLRLDALKLNWVVTAYILGSAVFLLPLGRLADIVGRKPVFVIGMIVFTLGALLGGLTGSGEMLIGLRAFQGVGGAMIFGCSTAMLTAAFPANRRGHVLGLNVGAVYVGLSVGPAVGGLVTHWLGWRWVMHMTFLMGAAAVPMILMARHHEERPDATHRFDTSGALLYAAGMLAVMGGLALAPSEPRALWAAAAGSGLLALFAAWQIRHHSPLLDPLLFRNVSFTCSNIAALIHYSATFACGYLISLYLQVVRGMNAQQAGLVLLMQPVVMALFSPATGRMSDRVEPRILASAGMGITLVGLLLFAMVGQATPVWFVGMNLVLIGAGFALFSSPNTNAIMSSIPKRHYGVGSGAVGTMRLAGQALSMVFVSYFFASCFGAVEPKDVPPPALVKAMRLSFCVSAVLCLAGIAASLARGQMHNGREE